MKPTTGLEHKSNRTIRKRLDQLVNEWIADDVAYPADSPTVHLLQEAVLRIPNNETRRDKSNDKGR